MSWRAERDENLLNLKKSRMRASSPPASATLSLVVLRPLISMMELEGLHTHAPDCDKEEEANLKTEISEICGNMPCSLKQLILQSFLTFHVAECD